MAVRLFIGNLPYDVTEAELRAHFAAVGPLASLALPTDRDTGRPRGFAFVEFRERADAEEAIRHLNNQVFKGRPLGVSEARARDDRTTTGPSRTAAPRSSISAGTSAGDRRNFGPDAAPRRWRKPAKGAAHAEHGPKRPIDKRATGPRRFSTEEDGTMRMRAANTVRVAKNTLSMTTPHRRSACVRDRRDRTRRRGTRWRSNRERPFKSVPRKRPASKSSTTKRSGGWRQKSGAVPARRAWRTMSWRASVCTRSRTQRLANGMMRPPRTETPAGPGGSHGHEAEVLVCQIWR